ncbi:MAG: amidohydrolase [Deltaproteobacteria bacterium]|nr:amidohydrolase [Deltaproteobacteria bacterium]
MKIDVFPHILPVKYKEAFQKINRSEAFVKMHSIIPTLYDLDYRFRIMDQFGDLVQVLTLSGPPVESFADANQSSELSKLANDEMAELVAKYPDRFVAAVACLPMNNVDAAMSEVDRAIRDLHFKGVQIFTPINDKPLDSPEFLPLYEKMSRYDLPIWIHPQREADYPDYRSEKKSKYAIHSMLGWVYETSSGMVRLVLGGILEKYPKLKFIVHHGGAMIPFLHRRVESFVDFSATRLKNNILANISDPAIDYFKLFYADTAIYGNTAGLMCSYDFFGSQHLLFGTDMPYDSQFGLTFTGETIRSIEHMAIEEAEKRDIFEDNARRLLSLTP